MIEQHFNPEHIIELAEDLRLAGFDIGTQQYIAAQDLLIALAAHNRLPADPRDWRSLLAPIFCASPAEQEEFYGRFDLWLDRHPEWKTIEDDLTEPGKREIALPAASILWLRKPVGIVTAALLILLIGFVVFLSLKTNRTLTGQVFSSDGDKPVPEAHIEFFNQQVKTDSDGKFTINYQPRNWSRMFNRQVAQLKVTDSEHETFAGTRLDVHQPSHQTIKLQKRPVAPDDPATTIKAFPEEAPPPAIPLLPGFNVTQPPVGSTPQTIRWYHWLLVASPLVLFAIWLLLRWRRRRALLQKLQAAGSPNLRRLTVRGASEQLFQSQTFRRAVQDLRRHRRVVTRELDIPGTVRATINRGGMFAPLYGARKALPEYLLLIDRASPADEQARFADELSHRLEAGGVFVDRFYFQNDPRTCRQREPNSPTVTLLDLAARYPDHQLLIFSDGAGFISPLTGEPEHWLTHLSHWPRRVLLTPELDEQKGYRELALAENDFLVLPANDDGLNVLTEAINAGELPNLKTRQDRNGGANPFPRLILERPKRWLERHEPRPAVLNELCDQLRAYLGEEEWYWLAACAVYPALSWDVTLYLGYKLFGKDEDFEERLLRLIRLPWFRYGSMPDWLRLQLIESFTPEQESEVRQTIETMLLSTLDHPNDGIPLEIAERQSAEPGNWLQRWKAKWNNWRQRKRLADLIEHEPEESPLKDFVFLGFLSGGRARRLTVKLPDLLNRVLFPQGQAVLGFRPATAAVLAILLSGTGAAYVVNRLQQVPNTPPTLSQFYQQWDQNERSRFVVEMTQKVLAALANQSNTSLKQEDFELIREKVSEYAVRVGNGSTYDIFAAPGQPGQIVTPEDLRYVFGRGTSYAPEISRAFTGGKFKRELPGLYLAMAESEFRKCPADKYGRQGMFLRPGGDGCNWQQDARLASDYFVLFNSGGSYTSNQVLLAVAGFNYTSGVNSDSLSMRSGYLWNQLQEMGNLNDQQQTQQQRAEQVDYVYRFLAAAVVGENPHRFGLDMNPLSSYGQTDAAIKAETPTPTPTTTPRRVGCQTDSDLQGQYVIRSILAREANGRTTDIGEQYPLGPVYLGKKYSEADGRKILGDAGSILDAEKISLPSPGTCAVMVDPNDCRKESRGAKCVDIFLIGGRSSPPKYPTTTSEGSGDQTRTFTDPNCPIERVVGKKDRGNVISIEVVFRDGRKPVNLPKAQERTAFYGNCAAILDAAYSVSDGSLSLLLAQEALRQGPRTVRSPDGRIQAVISDDKVRLVDTSSNRELRTLNHDSPVLVVAFDPLARAVATLSQGGTIRIWDARTGQETRRLDGMSTVTNMEFSPAGDRLLTYGTDRIIRVWDYSSLQLIFSLQHSGIVVVKFSTDGKYLAVAERDVTTYEAYTWKILYRLQGEPGDNSLIRDLQFSDGGRIIRAIRSSGKVDTWDMATGRLQRPSGR